MSFKGDPLDDRLAVLGPAAPAAALARAARLEATGPRWAAIAHGLRLGPAAIGGEVTSRDGITFGPPGAGGSPGRPEREPGQGGRPSLRSGAKVMASIATWFRQILIVLGAGHVDLYDRVNLIPFGKLQAPFTQYLA